MAEVEIIKPNMSLNHIENFSRIKRKKKVCAYCRVSTDLEDQRSSYYSQIEHYGNFIKQNKEWEFVGIYADDGITGTSIKNRDEFIRMIDDCKLGKIDIIIAKSISRFARNTVDTLNTVRLLRELDIDVYFEKENIHTLKMDSEMFLTLYSAFAQAESESTSMNVKLGYRAKMKRGEPVGGIECFGYIWDKNEKKMVVNEKEAKVVRKIFKMYLEGDGTTVIARKLTDEGIPSPKGNKKWWTSPIKDIIRNVKYVGDLIGQKSFIENPITHRQVKNRGQQPKYYVKNHHEPIIDRKTFDKAQEIYEKRSIQLKNGKEYCEKYSLRYTLSSMIHCAECGNTYVRRYTKYKNKDGVIHDHIYWTCSSRANSIISRKKCKCSVSIRDEEIKSLFVALFNKFLNSTRSDNLINKIKSEISNDNTTEKLNKVNKKIEHVKEQMSKLLDLNIAETINHDVFSSKNTALNNELAELEKDKDEILNSKNKIHKEEKRLKIIEKELNNSKTLNNFNDEVFKKLINKVIIGEYNENNEYDPNVVKFVLNIKNISSNNTKKFLSLELDERVHKANLFSDGTV